MTPDQMDEAMDRHFGYEAADDVEGVLATMSDRVIHDIVGFPAGPSEGHDQARSFYQAMFADLADGQVETIRRLYGTDFMVDESRWTGRAPGRPFGVEGRNRPLSFRLLHVVEFESDGRFRRENVWVDLAAIQAQLAQ
ncbi:ester cyclase [Sphingomonas xanthus]|nr:ester cyclase [Sphingomonas xanthus]